MSGNAPVLIMAGGTGGHIFPGLAVADVLRARGVPVAWLGSVGGLETQLVPQHGLELHVIAVHGLRGKSLLTVLLAPWMLLRAVFQALTLLRRLRPRSVLSMGGYAAGPGGLAAWLLRRPLLLHEQNSVAGMTNTWLARVSRCVLTGFPGVFDQNSKAEWVGNPVRMSIASLAAPAERMQARQGRSRLLVLGGSLGARSLNLGVPAALAALAPEQRPEVRHQAGKRGLAEALDAYADAGVSAQVDAFVEDMAQAYAWADLVICRAGALTLAELCVAGIGAVLVPFPHAVDDHQTRNAEALVAAGSAILLPEQAMNAEALASQLKRLLGDRRSLLAMAEAARTLARPQAAEVIADRCLEVSA